MNVPAEPPDGMTLRGDLVSGLDRDQRIVVCLAETQKAHSPVSEGRGCVRAGMVVPGVVVSFASDPAIAAAAVRIAAKNMPRQIACNRGRASCRSLDLFRVTV